MSLSPLEENIASHETPGTQHFPPFAVTPEAKEHWLACFRAGLDEVQLTPEQDAQFWDYATHAAQFMVNSLE